MKQIAALSLLICLTASLAAIAQPLQADSISKFYTGGIRINNTNIFGVVGMTFKWSNTIYQFVGLDLGGREQAKTTTILLRFHHTNRDCLFLLFGPSLESILPTSCSDITIDYLCGAAGMLWAHRFSPTISSWLALSYLGNDDIRHPIKIGAGITVPFILKD